MTVVPYLLMVGVTQNSCVFGCLLKGLFGPDRYGSSVHGPLCFGSDGVRCWWGCSWINRSRHDVFCSCGQWRWGSSRESCCCSTVSRSCRTHQCGHSGCGKCRRGSRWSGGMGVL